MAVFVNTLFEARVERLFDLAELVEKIFSSAGLDYRVVGGLAKCLYVEESDPESGRLTKDIDIAIRRQDLERIAKAAEPFGLQHRHVAGVDMLVQAAKPSAKSVHVYPEAAPDLGTCRRIKGLRLIPLEDLVRMKRTGFRAKDEAHLKDLDQAGLITAEMEAGLAPALAERLAQVRARE